MICLFTIILLYLFISTSSPNFYFLSLLVTVSYCHQKFSTWRRNVHCLLVSSGLTFILRYLSFILRRPLPLSGRRHVTEVKRDVSSQPVSLRWGDISLMLVTGHRNGTGTFLLEQVLSDDTLVTTFNIVVANYFYVCIRVWTPRLLSFTGFRLLGYD